jgi:hypothetical protein
MFIKDTETGTFYCFFGAVIIKWTVPVTRATGTALYRKGIPMLQNCHSHPFQVYPPSEQRPDVEKHGEKS